MCGIAAIFAYHKAAPPVDQEELLRMREHMLSRGPDGSGLWLSEEHRVGLAHRRLSIIDLSDTGAQPMIDPSTNNVIVYNGEIYNYRELRTHLEAKGYQFRSSSDTEVLLKLYADRGEEMVHDLRGMYAFVIYDSSLSSLFIVRDPYGIKPLYLHDNGATLRIASQVKALLAGGNIALQAEPAGHAGFFLWGHVPEPYTLYKSIRAFAPGTSLRIDAHGTRKQHQFCSIPDELAKAAKKKKQVSIQEAAQELRMSLLDTVQAHLVADVPVGIFLSSGLDSTTITALAAEVGADLRTVTLGFEEFKGTENDETPLAQEVARHYGAKHQTIWITRDEFQQEYDRLIHAMDQPTIDGINTYFVSMAARKAGLKVALSGLGGDELFGGYPSFRQIPRSVQYLGWSRHTPRFGRLLRSIGQHVIPCISGLISPKYAGLFEYGGSYEGAYMLRRALYMPWELPALMTPHLAEQGVIALQTGNALRQTTQGIGGEHYIVSALEVAWYMRNQLLRDTDWASMAQSLEVRVPLVDLHLLRSTAPLLARLTGSGKQAMAGTPDPPLPDKILHRPKTGFTVPIQEWLTGSNGVQERGLRGWSRHIYREFSS